MVGMVQCIAAGRPLRASARMLAVVLLMGIQIAARWVSFHPSIANRRRLSVGSEASFIEAAVAFDVGE